MSGMVDEARQEEGVTEDKATALMVVGGRGSSLSPACTPTESNLPRDHRDPTVAVREGCWEEAAQTGLFDGGALYPRRPRPGRAISHEGTSMWEFGISPPEQESRVRAEGDERLGSRSHRRPDASLSMVRGPGGGIGGRAQGRPGRGADSEIRGRGTASRGFPGPLSVCHTPTEPRPVELETGGPPQETAGYL